MNIAHSRLSDARAIAKLHKQPIDYADSWQALYEKACMLESIAKQIIELADGYDRMIGRKYSQEVDDEIDPATAP